MHDFPFHGRQLGVAILPTLISPYWPEIAIAEAAAQNGYFSDC